MKTSTRLIWLLSVASVLAYALRTNITIAQEYMAPALGLTMADMGVISAWGFQLAYALFQIPAGFLGDRYGARLILGLAILGWGVASFASALVPAVAGTAFLGLLAARVLLGVGQAAMYPVAALAVAEHVPVEKRVTSIAMYISAAMLGSALAPLTLAPLMVLAGWRTVFIVSGLVAVLVALLWFAFAPRDPDVSQRVATPIGQQFRETLKHLGHRPLMILSVSYLLHSATFFVFIFWFFRYLTEARGFSVLASGVWGSVPSFMAFVIAPPLGSIADRLSHRMPSSKARRRVAMSCLFAAAMCVVVGANLPSPYLAVFALGLSVACINGAEGPFWATAAAVGRDSPGTAGGVLNLMGNLGGVLSIWLVPVMKDAWGWTLMLGVWAVVAVAAAFLWLAVQAPDADIAITGA